MPVHHASTAGRVLVRISQRRLTTDAVTPPKKRRVLRNVLLATTALTTTFYVGSTFVAFNSEPYHQFFTERVPFGRAFIQFGQVRHWDVFTVNQAVQSGKNAVRTLVKFVSSKLGGSSPAEPPPTPKDTPPAPAPRVEVRHPPPADRLKSVARTLKTDVDRTEHEMKDKGRKAIAIARHQSIQFSEGVEELARKAEAALASTAAAVVLSDSPHPQPNAVAAVPAAPPPTTESQQLVPVAVETSNESTESKPPNPPKKVPKEVQVYTGPLPIGFEPPPGYSAPKTRNRDKLVPLRKSEPRPKPLPLITPELAQYGANDLIIVQLASTIDNLASYLKPSSSASSKAQAALETAKMDLTQLANRLETIREEGQSLLEQKLDERTKEFTLKLLELEMEARDQLEAEKISDTESAQFRSEFRKKVDEELRRQSEWMNEQFKERLTPAAIEMQQRWIVDLKDRMEHERTKRLAKLDELFADVKRLERVVLDNATHLDESTHLNELWAALRALSTAAVDSPARKPFRQELRALHNVVNTATTKDDPVVSTALASLDESDIPDIGVEPLGDLATWFVTSVVPHVSEVALVPDENAGVLSHLASRILSSLRFQRHGLVPGTDVLSVLARAEYYLNGKDLDSAARELNQLKGPAKLLLADWMDAARRRLEVQNALQVIEQQVTRTTQR